MTARTAIASRVAAALRDFGYPDATTAMLKEVLDAWIEGRRGDKLPHGIIGMLAERQFEEVEEARPGMLAKLKNA